VPLRHEIQLAVSDLDRSNCTPLLIRQTIEEATKFDRVDFESVERKW
jgi:hypothetical protein